MFCRILTVKFINICSFTTRTRSGNIGLSLNQVLQLPNCFTEVKSIYNRRHYVVALGNADVEKAVESIGDKFKDSLDLLEEAKSSLGTVYFSSDMKDAEKSVEETLSDFQQLVGQISSEHHIMVRRTIESKMEELKLQLHMLKESVKTVKMKY